MMRLFAIGMIWIGCAVAWMVLGSSLVVRSQESSGGLLSEVQLLWGPPLEQHPPTASWREMRRVATPAVTFPNPRTGVSEEVTTKNAPRDRMVEVDVPIPLEGSEIAAALDLEHRRKGLLWFPTYSVAFQSEYAFRNDTDQDKSITLRFPLASGNVVYDDFRVTGADAASMAVTFEGNGATWKETFRPGETKRYRVGYRSRGTSKWQYHMTDGTGQVRNFHLRMTTDFPNVDFPAGSLSPTRHAAEGKSWSGDWTFASLVANAPIGLKLPELLNPGPLASKITFFAPIGLLFFFFVVSVFGAAQGRNIHPMNFLLIGCAFFAFHLLFAYLVDHLAIAPSFAIAAAVAVLLVVSYARLFTGWLFALREMGLSQLIFLVLFSFTFFWQGYTGLAITIGAILTLFVMMQVTGRTRWDERVGGEPPELRKVG